MVRIESNIYNKTTDNDIILGANIIIYNSDNNEVQKISIVDETELNRLKSELDVLDETFVRFNDNSSLSGKSIDNLLSNSDNNVVINATKFAGLTSDNFSKTDHTHDDRYFTESEITTKLNAKANSSHNHNTWSTVSSGVTGGTLYVNTALRIAFFHIYVQNKKLSSSGDGTSMGTISSAYKPKSGVTTACYNPDIRLAVNSDGKVYARPTTDKSSATVNAGVMWIY